MGGRRSSYLTDRRHLFALVLALVWVVSGFPLSAVAGPEEAKRWIDTEFQPSTLSRDQQMAEMAWFIEAAKPYRGMTIHVLSEILDVHTYESKVLAKAFSEITGINVVHHLLYEGQVVDRVLLQVQSKRLIYDAYVNDSDFIGTHYRSGAVWPLTDWMAGEGRDVTLPTLDIDDFIGKSFTTGLDGKLYQLPDQQFANLYWFRHDWFQRPDLRARFKARFGYELDVPQNWTAYEDIADFFTNDVKEIDGQRVWGHMDYGARDPSLGWRFTDAWIGMAGGGDKGLPNGRPVDEWGIRMEGCSPVGASVQRGGETNGPAAVYALDRYLDWLNRFAPPAARGMTFSEAGPVPAEGHIAQQIFWYLAFTPSMIKPGLPVVNADGTPKWRMAPSPHGAYWEPGQKLGYQDTGAWTLFRSTPLPRAKAAWLYAQFTVSKTVSLRKLLVGMTPIRQSDLDSPAMTEAAPRLGGLVEFYRGPARASWTPTGINVPDYAKLADLWWKNIALAISGERTPQQTMDGLAEQMDRVLGRLERQGMARCTPKLNPRRSADEWLASGHAPKRKLADERPPGVTVPYETLLEAWRQGRPK
jgi:glycerol transport system substrate-binding protein